MRKVLLIMVIVALYCKVSSAQTYRTGVIGGETYSVKITDDKYKDEIKLSIILFNELFVPTLYKQWDQYSKSYQYVGTAEKFKFIMMRANPNGGKVRDDSGNISQFKLSVFDYSNGFQNMFTKMLFADIYHLVR